MTYKWQNPQEWLLEKCQEAAGRDDSAFLLGVINAIVPSMDPDEVQDRFQSEMDQDGYFEEIYE